MIHRATEDALGTYCTLVSKHQISFSHLWATTTPGFHKNWSQLGDPQARLPYRPLYISLIENERFSLKGTLNQPWSPVASFGLPRSALLPVP